ncbi:MAG TPA: trehalose-phosphatase [Streptosporangiaceae bacterium]|nr:trehalose-phosphatase [Streptosporangiaceae bacterium]
MRPGAANSAVPEPTTEPGRAGLAALLGQPGRALIALDFDGTLAPIVEDPAAARALPAAVSALRSLTPLVGTVAVITGRPARTAVEYGSLDQVPGIVVLGHYGRQRWAAGELTSPPAPPGLAVARERLPGVLAEVGAPDGTWIEDKADALAVHTRRAADPASALNLVSAPLLRLAAATGLRAEPGRFVVELRPPGADKGLALADLAAERPRSAVLFCGDDLGDRPAFNAVRRLREAGQPGLSVCSGSAEVPALAAEADLVVAGPQGVADLLAALASAIGARAGRAAG